MNNPIADAMTRERLLLNATRELHDKSLTRGQLIQHLRKTGLALNQSELAEYCNVSRRTLTSIENDESGLNEESISRVLRFFGLEVSVMPISTNQRSKLREKDF